MSKHTPGPWHVDGTPGTTEVEPEWSIESDYGQVAVVMSENCEYDWQIRADADLIAAAPTLLSELVRARDMLAELNDHHLAHVATAVRAIVHKRIESAAAAIAKAEGDA